MQSILIGSLTVGVLVACHGSTGTPSHEEATPAAATERAPSGNAEVARATRATDVTVSVTGLAAWSAGDSLQLADPDRGIVARALEEAFAAYPRAGETTIAAQHVDWAHTGLPLVAAARDERLLLTQLVAATSGDTRYSALARAGVVRGLTVNDGQAASLSAQLAEVAQDRAVTLRWRGGQFAALVEQAGADAQPGGAATVEISAVVDGTGDLHAAYQAGLPSLVTFPPLAAADGEHRVVYGSPFPGGEVATALYSASVPVVTRFGTGSVLARFVSSVPVAALAKGALAPQLSPVREVKLDGVGTSPSLVSWQPPALGKATDYAVTVSVVEGSEQGVAIKPLATFSTKGTSLHLPADVVTIGRSYVLTITARSSDGSSFALADHVTAQLEL